MTNTPASNGSPGTTEQARVPFGKASRVSLTGSSQRSRRSGVTLTVTLLVTSVKTDVEGVIVENGSVLVMNTAAIVR